MEIHRRPRRAGFSLIEVMLAVTIAMILLYAALFSAAEAVAVVSEGDAQMHTHVQAQRALDRLLKDVRYASMVEVGGDGVAGWDIQVETTGSLSAGTVSYAWDAATGLLTIGTDAGTEWAVEDLREFDLEVETVTVGTEVLVSGLTVRWVVGEDAGGYATAAGMHAERVTELSGSARLRIRD